MFIFVFVFVSFIVDTPKWSLNTIPDYILVLLLQGLTEPEFYGDSVFKFRKIAGKPGFTGQFSKIAIGYKRKGYNIDAIKYSAYLAVDTITVDHFAYLFNYTRRWVWVQTMIARN